MTKDEILEKSRHEFKNDEINEYISNKTMRYVSCIFIVSCLFMIILSFQSSKQAEIFYTTATLFCTFLCIYCWTHYYYSKKIWSLIFGIMVFLLVCYFITKVWILIW